VSEGARASWGVTQRQTLTLARDRNAFHRRRCASAIRARPAFVLGPVDIPPWNRQRRFPGTTLMMHGAPARVLAQHLGRNLRFRLDTLSRNHGYVDHPVGRDAERSELKRAFCSSLSEL